MECNFCHSQQAKIFLSQIFKGEVIKLDLCESCARQLEVTDVQGVAVNELIDKIRQIQEETREDVETVCSECGLSLDEMKKRGELGCPACYQAFGSEISGIIRENQKGSVHAGKMPRDSEHEVVQFRRQQLEEKLQQAVETEDFETAARLRDELSSR